MVWRTILPTSENPSFEDNAEQRFRGAFERLKLGIPRVLPKGTRVSQNNVAKEAGCRPGALKKCRFPLLVAEIQELVGTQIVSGQESMRSKLAHARNKSRSCRQTIADFKLQRDTLAGLLSDANLRIVQLTEEVSSVRTRLDSIRPSASISNFPNHDHT